MVNSSRSVAGAGVLPTLVVAGAGLVGCGADAGAPSCDVVPPAVVRSALGTDVGPATRSGADSTAVCTFTTVATPARTIIVRMQRGIDAAAFARTREGFTATGQPAQDLTGFFDAAFVSVLEAQPLTTTTLVARRGSDEVLVTSPGTVEQERALVTAVFAALR